MNQNPDDLRTAGLHRGPNHIDYRETDDVTNVHSAVQREHSVGTPGAVPMPLWLMALCGVAIFWAGTSFSGGFGSTYFSADNYSVHPGAEVGGQAGGPAGAAPALTVAEQGKVYYLQNCQQCHQANGMGSPGQYPPIGGSEYINGGSRRLGMILLKGISGPLTVEGKPYGSAAMPPWQTLPDKKIAAILTYERSDFGNHSGPITPDQITDARKEFASHPDSWTEADLKAVPPDAELPGGEPPAGAAPGAAASPAAAAAAGAKK